MSAPISRYHIRRIRFFIVDNHFVNPFDVLGAVIPSLSVSLGLLLLHGSPLFALVGRVFANALENRIGVCPTTVYVAVLDNPFLRDWVLFLKHE